jgi:hypothetical protein
VVVPLAQTRTAAVPGDERVAHPVCPLGARLCDAADGGGGAEVSPTGRYSPGALSSESRARVSGWIHVAFSDSI